MCDCEGRKTIYQHIKKGNTDEGTNKTDTQKIKAIRK